MKKPLLILFTAAFMALCLLPTLGLLFGYQGENYENRPLARLPELTDRAGLNMDFPTEFDDYFQDHFGFREEMVTSFHSLTDALLQDTLNEDVIIGQNDMLYYGETMDDYLGIDRLSDYDISRAARVLAIQQRYVTDSGAAFAFTTAPNKNTIYPEYMPSRLSPAQLPSNRERLAAALESMGVEYIDLTSELISQKAEGLLYHYHDTHWNQQGALAGYRAIMEQIAPAGLDYDTYDNIAPEIKTSWAGDLHYFLYPASAGNMEYPDYGLEYDYATDPQTPGRTVTIGTTSGANDFSLLLYRDSFGDGIMPYFSANIGRVLYDAEFPYNYASMDAEQPDVVVIELVERNIPNLLASAPAMAAKATDPVGDTVNVTSAISTLERNGSRVVYGLFDGADYDPAAQRILLYDGMDYYEAFPVTEESAAGLTLDAAVTEGFTLTLPDDYAGSGSFEVVIEG